MSAISAEIPTHARLTLFALSLGNFVVGIAAFVVLGLMSTITRSLSIDPAEGARLITYYAVAYAIGSPLLVAMTGRVARRTVAAGAMLMVGLGSLACALAPSLGWMEIARIFTAFGSGLYSPATAAVAVSLVPTERRGWALSQVFIGFTAAQGIGNPIGAWLGYTFGWQAAFLVVGAMALAMVLVLWWIMPAAIAFRPTSLRELGRILVAPHMLVSLLFTVFFVGGTYTTLTYLTLILETRLGLSGTGISILLAVYGGMAFVAAVMSGWLTDTFKPSRILTVLCVLLAVLLPLITQGPSQLALFTLLLAAWSLASWSHFTAQQSRLVSIEPPLAQLLLAMNSSMLYVGIAMGSMLAARLLPVPEFRGLAIGAVVQTVIAIGVLWLGDRMIVRHRAARA
jgi:MFS transporter, DHA1 family, inner membrane transport protein